MTDEAKIESAKSGNWWDGLYIVEDAPQHKRAYLLSVVGFTGQFYVVCHSGHEEEANCDLFHVPCEDIGEAATLHRGYDSAWQSFHPLKDKYRPKDT